ncbi:HAMP domain-containing histidine kinase [Actinospica durhamensis]|uniref:histidine kinase n=1 Tax=Actinospica durhamensis TaxID=1508375 RepID=A0A941ITN8_9ACTN|nr:HAMP domain-containing sensor histidine kinase [Actinospica durhamensis]MBR7837852.1 HAMP domain-containing histidine kinase [Actinospica durhamensis]
MSRRIALVTMGLITALLILAVVPLGLSLTANERASFRFAVESSARQLSAQAEEYLADHDPPTAMNQALAEASEGGDCAVVLRASGQVVATTACASGPPARASVLAGEVRSGAEQTAFAQQGDWLLAAVPVGDDGHFAGVAVLARSADPVNDRVGEVWAWLSVTGLAVLALGALLARRLARWVARPLTVLSSAASRLGDGDLDARAPTGEGPDEVRELSAVFNRMAERTASLIGAHREWVADVSHQLRTPLTALRLRVDLLADDAEQETAAEMAELQVEMARLASLVDGLLAVARAEGELPRPEAVRADQVVAERVAAWEPVAADRGVALDAMHTAAQPTLAHIGPGDLDQMLDNLIANALDSVPEGGHVRVSATGGRAAVVVRVVDDGPGMSEQARATAFRRFGRSGTGGSGLGLAIVNRLASVNGGRVTLEHTPGGGLTVRIELPAQR